MTIYYAKTKTFIVRSPFFPAISSSICLKGVKKCREGIHLKQILHLSDLTCNENRHTLRIFEEKRAIAKNFQTTCTIRFSCQHVTTFAALYPF